MDKILITTDDIQPLYDWRDEHIDLVLRCPCPLKGIEIHVKPVNRGELETGFYLRCIREKPDRLRLYLGTEGEKAQGYFLLEHMPDGRWRLIKDTIGNDVNFDPNKKEFGDSLVALYCSLMAIMVYSSDIELPGQEGKPPKETKGPAKKPKKDPQKQGHAGITYILHRSGNAISVGYRGSHASPKGIFTVRGHWRHYKNGNVIWITEYKKGTGDRKKKTYKIGGLAESG